MKDVIAKLGNMRKAVQWTIYPKNNDEYIQIQSDARIARVYIKTGDCILSAHHSNGSYGVHLSSDLGATKIKVSPEFVAELVSKQPKSGDVLIQAGAFQVIAA